MGVSVTRARIFVGASRISFVKGRALEWYVWLSARLYKFWVLLQVLVLMRDNDDVCKH